MPNTTTEITEEWIREHITTDVVREYLTAEYGQRLRLWSDGSTDTEGQGTYDASEWRTYRGGQEPEVVASTRCPGIGQLDMTDFSAGFCHRDDGDGWVEDASGKRKGGGIRRCC